MKHENKDNVKRKAFAVRMLCVILAFLMISGLATTIIFYLMHGAH